ncbi:MAG: hypothetical protein K2G67_00965 [Muribaculaceae bacterium]|nr:hypothetical protein [Muribaculaceae bacterium]
MKNASSHSRLAICAYIIGTIWLLLQIVIVVVYKDIPQGYDAVRYQRLAESMTSTGEWYPTAEQIEDSSIVAPYIIYPGLINYLILLIKIFGSIRPAFWINVAFNIIYAASGIFIANKLAGKGIGYLYFILFCLSHQNVLDVGFTLSELPSLALAYAGAALCISSRRTLTATGGLLFGLSYYFRPSAILVLLTVMVLIITLKKSRIKLITLLTGTAVSLCGIMIMNHVISEKYWFISSNTLGINMYLGANDESTGLTGGTTDRELDEEISGHNSFESDAIYRHKAEEWIADHPTAWLGLAIKKLDHQTTTDHLFHMYRLEENPVIAHDDIFLLKCIKICWLWYPRIYDWVLVLLFVYGLWMWRSKLKDGYWPMLIPVAGTLLLCILTIADYRYNATMMPVLYFFGAIGISRLKGLIR